MTMRASASHGDARFKGWQKHFNTHTSRGRSNMPKYNVGDVAALFPKPSEPETDTGKKIKSLFDEFYKKSSKKLEKPNQAPYKLKKKHSVINENSQVENQSEPKQKKRKFHDTEDSEDISEKKFKKAKKIADTTKPAHESAYENSNQKTVTNEETYFPRNKKSKNLKSMKGETSLFSEMTENDTSFGIKEGAFGSVNNENHHVKKLKKNNKSDINKSFDVEQSHKRIKKNQVQDEEIDNSVAVYTMGKMLDKKVSIKSPQKKKQKKAKKNNVDGKATINCDTEKDNEKDEAQLQKTNNISSKEDEFDQKKESENDTKLIKNRKFSKMPEETSERLSRTLFVGNLPISMTRQMLKKLFVPFGSVETCRLRCSVPTKATIPKKIADIKNKLHAKQRSRVGYVVFKDESAAAQAMSLNGMLVGDHHIIVNLASRVGEKKVYDERRSIFIGNLPYDVDEDVIWNTFSECGTIEAVRIIRDRETGVGKGIGYVLFQKIQFKENALALENIKIADRIIRIKQVQANPGKSQLSNQWSAVKRKAMKAKTLHEGKGKSRKTLKKMMKKEKLNHQKKKFAGILKKFSD